MLETRPLGRTGMDITRVGVGAWAIGGAGGPWNWGPQDDEASVAAIRRAVARGVNWVDTAPAYGLGHSETVVARALRDLDESERPFVFTKCGLFESPAGPTAPLLRSGAADLLRRDLEASLARLEVERIDLYQMHWPAEDAAVEEYWGTLLEMKAEGKVRAVGLSNHDVSGLEAAEAVGHVDSLQPPLSLVRREALDAVVPWCAEHGTGVIVYSPMQAGLLSGAFSAERVASLPKGDWRTRDAAFQGVALEATLALVDALRPVAERHGSSVASVSIAWTVAVEGVTGAIVGARNADQVDGWFDAASLELDDEDLAEIRSALASTGAGTGPTR